jgi:outer membrane receptor protein involved in Fe transport
MLRVLVRTTFVSLILCATALRARAQDAGTSRSEAPASDAAVERAPSDAAAEQVAEDARDAAQPAAAADAAADAPVALALASASEPPAAHTHEHVHTIVHSHAHATREPHRHEFGAKARVARNPRAASSYTLQRRDLPRGAHVTPADLVRAVPGTFVIQHAGGGKANQYFLRGFDADHGTDVALSVDGVPVNMVSHGHGQGYADLNWVIPELVERVEVSKGANDPRFGDFATAGAIDMQTYTHVHENRASAEAGVFHSYRGLILLGHEWQKLQFTGAAEVTGSDGPFEREENLRRGNLFARVLRKIGGGELSLTLTGYLSDWNASGQIPLRAVAAGSLDRFGYVDPNEGGSSMRSNLYLRFRSDPGQAQRWDVLGYLTAYRFALYSNFTFFSEDPVNGDMIHQRDERTLAGFKVRYARDDALGPFQLTSRFGSELRNDRIDNSLDLAPGREWAEALVDANVDQTSVGVFVEEEMQWLPWLRTSVALRGDGFLFAVDDALEDRASSGTRSSGERGATRLSPKAGLVISPLRWLELFANLGYGFHSNDARGVVMGVTPLTQARGYELGATLKAFDRLRARLALFRLDLDSELVWVGDAGTTEARGATERQGIELDLRLDILSWLWADASLALTRARFKDAPSDADAVPLAPRRIVSGRITAAHPQGYFGRLAVFSLGDRPATEDEFLTAQGFTRLDLSLGYRHPRFELALSLENLLNTHWREAQFANVSRLQSETGPASCSGRTRAVEEGGQFMGCEDLHFTPGTPLAVRASASLLF